jgi:uncharacterized membrane protein
MELSKFELMTYIFCYILAFGCYSQKLEEWNWMLLNVWFRVKIVFLQYQLPVLFCIIES